MWSGSLRNGSVWSLSRTCVLLLLAALYIRISRRDHEEMIVGWCSIILGAQTVLRCSTSRVVSPQNYHSFVTSWSLVVYACIVRV